MECGLQLHWQKLISRWHQIPVVAGMSISKLKAHHTSGTCAGCVSLVARFCGRYHLIQTQQWSCSS